MQTSEYVIENFDEWNLSNDFQPGPSFLRYDVAAATVCAEPNKKTAVKSRPNRYSDRSIKISVCSEYITNASQNQEKIRGKGKFN